MRICLIYDSGNPEQNVEQLEGFTSEEAAEAACERNNLRDYPEGVEASEDDPDPDSWRWTYVDVEVES